MSYPSQPFFHYSCRIFKYLSSFICKTCPIHLNLSFIIVVEYLAICHPSSAKRALSISTFLSLQLQNIWLSFILHLQNVSYPSQPLFHYSCRIFGYLSSFVCKMRPSHLNLSFIIVVEYLVICHASSAKHVLAISTFLSLYLQNIWLSVILHLQNVSYPSQPFFHYSCRIFGYLSSFICKTCPIHLNLFFIIVVEYLAICHPSSAKRVLSISTFLSLQLQNIWLSVILRLQNASQPSQPFFHYICTIFGYLSSFICKTCPIHLNLSFIIVVEYLAICHPSSAKRVLSISTFLSLQLQNIWLSVILHLQNVSYPSQPFFHYSCRIVGYLSSFICKTCPIHLNLSFIIVVEYLAICHPSSAKCVLAISTFLSLQLQNIQLSVILHLQNMSQPSQPSFHYSYRIFGYLSSFICKTCPIHLNLSFIIVVEYLAICHPSSAKRVLSISTFLSLQLQNIWLSVMLHLQIVFYPSQSFFHYSCRIFGCLSSFICKTCPIHLNLSFIIVVEYLAICHPSSAKRVLAISTFLSLQLQNIWLSLILHLQNVSQPSQPFFHYSCRKRDRSTFFHTASYLKQGQSIGYLNQPLNKSSGKYLTKPSSLF